MERMIAIVAEIYNVGEGKSKNVLEYNCRLRELLRMLENQQTNKLKKRWFIKALIPSMQKQTK